MSDTRFKQGDSLWSLTRKLLDKTNEGIEIDTSGLVIPSSMPNGNDVALGATTDAAATDSTSTWSSISLLKGLWNRLANLANLDVALSTRLKPSDTLAAVTTVGAITNPVTVAQATAANLKVDLSGSGALPTVSTVTAVTGITNPVTVAQATAANLKVDLLNSGALANVTTVGTVSAITSGNVGGFTFGIHINPTINTGAYSAGFTVGAIQTLTNAVRVSGGTGILESLIVTDTSNQKAALDIFIFESNPAAATTTDHAAFTFSTDILKVIAHIAVAAGDYVTVGSVPYAIARETSLGIALKASGSANLYAVAITSGTPTYAATALQFTYGILQD